MVVNDKAANGHANGNANELSENLARTTLQEIETEAPGKAAAPSASAALPIRNAAVKGLFEDEQAAYKGCRLSKRAQGNPVQEFGEKLDLIIRNSYDKDANPDGLINLGIAENTLMTQEYLDYFQGAIKHLQPYDLTYGTQSSGSRRLNEAIAKMWNENFAPVEPVQPGQIVTGPGASSVLDQLIAALLDPGQGVLLAGPHYNGFDVNMVARSGAKIRPAPIPLEDVFTPRELDHLEKELQAAKEDGVEVRAVMLCSPHNPYGRTYDKETLLAYAQFCEKHDLHLISDEIYALSVFDNPNLPDAPPFISMLSLDIAKETGKPFDKSRLHIVYSFSKDFGINGFRLGAVISQHNRFLLRCMMSSVFLMKVSSPADCLVSALLNDDAAFKRLTGENQRRLADSAAFMRDWFEKRGMKPMQSNAGHFMMIDVRERLGIRTFEDEKDIAIKSVPHGVLVGMGGSYHHPEPGWLRVTFSFDRPTLELALQRLAKALDL